MTPLLVNCVACGRPADEILLVPDPLHQVTAVLVNCHGDSYEFHVADAQLRERTDEAWTLDGETLR